MNITVVEAECNWAGSKTWVQWWTRTKHLQMLTKPFSVMNPEDWDRAPTNINGVERANYSAKSNGHKLSLYYRSPIDEKQRSQAAVRRKKQKDVHDKSASYGPPGKYQHFEDTDFEELRPRNKRKKVDMDGDEDNEGSKTPPSKRQEVEVLYADGMWYRGWLSFNFHRKMDCEVS